MGRIDNGGAAFPAHPNKISGYHESQGMALRDYFAAHAPITFDNACNTYGCQPNLNSDSERAAFFAVWAFLRCEYADAMLAERQKEPSDDRNEAADAAASSPWRPVDGTETGLGIAWCPPCEHFPRGRYMAWDAGDLKRAKDAPGYLRFHATYWMPIPSSPEGAKNG